MPNAIPAFECKICRTLYTRSKAYAKATACEKRGTPEYAFDIGDTFYLEVGWDGPKEMIIVERKIILSNFAGHVAAYLLAVKSTGEKMPCITHEGELKHEIAKVKQPR